MRKIDYKFGDLLIAEQEKKEMDEYDKYMSHEKEVKEICDYLISQKKVEAVERLIGYITENETALQVVANCNWGRILRLACKLFLMEEIKSNTILLNVGNLEQLLFIMRNLRFLNYRYQIFGEDKAKMELDQLMDYFRLNDSVKDEIYKVSTLPEGSY